MLGTLYTDTLTFSDGVVIYEQLIAVGSCTRDVGGSCTRDVDGILGLGPIALTAYSLVNEPDTLIPTVIDNLLEQGAISQHVISYFFAPFLDTAVAYGTITSGGIDPDDHTGPITYK